MSGRVLQVTEASIKALAKAWFLRGFRCSGYGAHGETRVGDSRAFEALLEAEFERTWADRRSAAVDARRQRIAPPKSITSG